MFNMTSYSRLLYLDSTAAVLKNLDPLLANAPPALIAAPRVYPSSTIEISPNFLLIQPSKVEYNSISQAGIDQFDVSSFSTILNERYISSAMILPKHPYELHTSELLSAPSDPIHFARLGPSPKVWNAKDVLDEAYYVHFTEEHLRPWRVGSAQDGPECSTDEKGRESCIDRDAWRQLYEDFRENRMDVCGLDLEPRRAV
jgi:alpha-N-acetylglucosamine transferase